MKIIKIGEPKTVMSNPDSHHNYFAWPTVARLQNGRLGVVASGFRLRHICPFGKTVICYSDNEGESYTLPAPVIDTPLDDRDGGIMTFGERGVIVTSFNNTVNFQQQQKSADEYSLAYLKTVSPQDESPYLGATFRISNDCGVTFGPIHTSPITSPHGPIELSDGTVLWVGRRFSPANGQTADDEVCAYRLYPNDGSMEYLGSIQQITEDNNIMLSCEPHALELDDGRIIVHIRVQKYQKDNPMFTVYQSESSDGGKTWTKPIPLLDRMGGSPPHLQKLSSGMLLCTYADRRPPYSIKFMFSTDSGRTWDTDHELCVNGVSADLGYPATVQLANGDLLTVFYAIPSTGEPAVILQQKWRMENDI